jgi:hypothetical protein
MCGIDTGAQINRRSGAARAAMSATKPPPISADLARRPPASPVTPRDSDFEPWRGARSNLNVVLLHAPERNRCPGLPLLMQQHKVRKGETHETLCAFGASVATS